MSSPMTPLLIVERTVALARSAGLLPINALRAKFARCASPARLSSPGSSLP